MSGAPFRVAHAGGTDLDVLCRACAEQLAPAPVSGLGFVYVSETFGARVAEAAAALRRLTGVEQWVGTGALGVCVTGREYYGEPAIVAMVATVARDDYLLCGNGKDPVAFTPEQQRWLTTHGPTFGVVHGDPRNGAIAPLLTALASDAGAFLVGGLSSADGGFAQVAGAVYQGGVSGVLFGARVPVVTGLTQGCLPIGPVHDVTACQRNIAIALDGRPALAVLKEEIGDRYGSDLRRIAGHVFAALPIPGSDRADYVVRNLTGIDAERELIAIGTPLTEGGHLMFCRRDPVAARLDLERMLADVAWRLTAPPRGGIYITCLARGPNMFGRDSGELGIVRAALGDVPLIGFFGNGEFSHDRLYTFTGVLSLFL